MSLPNQNSLLVNFSADFCHVFGCEEAVYGLGVFISGAGPHFPKIPYDIVRIHTLMIYKDIADYNVVGDTKLRFYQKLRVEISSQWDNT